MQLESSSAREARLLRAAAVPLMMLALVAMLSFLVPDISEHPAVDTILTGAFVLFVAISILLANRGRVSAASGLFLTALLLTLGSVIALYGGLAGADAVTLPIVIMAAGLLRGPRYAVAFAVVAVVMVVLLAMLETLGLTPVFPVIQTTLQAAIIVVLVCAVTAVFLFLALRELGRAETAASDSAAAAAHSERRLAEMIAQSPDGFVVMGTDGTILDSNSKMAELLRTAKDDLNGSQLADLPGLTSESRTLWLATLAEVLTGHPDGLVTIDVEHGDGEATTTLELHTRVATHADGSQVIHVIARDLTERTRIEKERAALAEQLEETHRLESLGRLAGGIAHDFNNLLTATVANGELISIDEGLPESIRRLGLEITQAGQRGGELTQQLLAYARKQMREPEVLSLADVIGDLRLLLERLIPENIQLEINCADRGTQVRADPSQLQQIVLNLASNARDAMPSGGKLTIETAEVDIDADYAQSHPDVTPGRYAAFVITDTGEGMDSETLARLFEPFFSTKEPHRGVGLGLATVHGIVKQSEGHILVYSEPGRGSSFKVLLPLVDGPAHRRAPPAPPERPTPMPSATILVVDDELLVRETAARMLESLGHTVLIASSAAEAIEKARAHPGTIDLVVTDVVLPHRAGPDLVRDLSQLRPDMRVLYISGYAENAIVHNGDLDDGVEFLAKPFSLTTLSDKIAEVLDKPAARMH